MDDFNLIGDSGSFEEHKIYPTDSAKTAPFSSYLENDLDTLIKTVAEDTFLSSSFVDFHDLDQIMLEFENDLKLAKIIKEDESIKKTARQSIHLKQEKNRFSSFKQKKPKNISPPILASKVAEDKKLQKTRFLKWKKIKGASKKTANKMNSFWKTTLQKIKRVNEWFRQVPIAYHQEEFIVEFPKGNDKTLTIRDKQNKDLVLAKIPLISKEEIQLGEEIGRGSFGQVFLAKHKEQRVVVKKLIENPDKTVADNLNKELLNEMLLHAIIGENENVVRLIGIQDDYQGIVLEYCEGGSVQEQEIDPEQKLECLKGMAKGMKALSQGEKSKGRFAQGKIIHRDLAARNVFWDKKRKQAKVADFGIARYLREEKESISDQKIMMNGPLKWMPPESLGETKFSVQSDIWAFGVTLWEIITREIPYGEMDDAEASGLVCIQKLKLELKEEHLAPFSDSNKKVLKEVFTKCLEYDKSDRFQSFSEIVEQLEKLT